jgi:hypothetical protein
MGRAARTAVTREGFVERPGRERQQPNLEPVIRHTVEFEFGFHEVNWRFGRQHVQRIASERIVS